MRERNSLTAQEWRQRGRRNVVGVMGDIIALGSVGSLAAGEYCNKINIDPFNIGSAQVLEILLLVTGAAGIKGLIDGVSAIHAFNQAKK